MSSKQILFLVLGGVLMGVALVFGLISWLTERNGGDTGEGCVGTVFTLVPFIASLGCFYTALFPAA